jgi:hypothetical protein
VRAVLAVLRTVWVVLRIDCLGGARAGSFPVVADLGCGPGAVFGPDDDTWYVPVPPARDAAHQRTGRAAA